jgi:hypothetical protein
MWGLIVTVRTLEEVHKIELAFAVRAVRKQDASSLALFAFDRHVPLGRNPFGQPNHSQNTSGDVSGQRRSAALQTNIVPLSLFPRRTTLQHSPGQLRTTTLPPVAILSYRRLTRLHETISFPVRNSFLLKCGLIFVPVWNKGTNQNLELITP